MTTHVLETGAVFLLEDRFSTPLEKLIGGLTKAEGNAKALQAQLDRLGLGAFVGKARADLDEIAKVAMGTFGKLDASAETGSDAALASIGRLSKGVGSEMEAIRVASTGIFSPMTTGAERSTTAVLKKIVTMREGVAEQLDLVRTNVAGVWTGFAEGADTAAGAAVTAMGRVAAAVDAPLASVRAMVAEMNTAAEKMAAISASSGMGAAAGRANLRDRAGHGRGGSGVHLGRMGAEIPGTGMHFSMTGTPVLAAAAMGLGAILEASEVADVLAKAGITGQLDMSGDFLHSKPAMELANLVKKTSAITGYSLKESGEAFLGTERMLGGTDFETRMKVMDTILPYAGLEAKMKEGTSLPESFESFIGLAHMTGEYNPEKLKELAKAFACTSINTTASLPQFEKTLSYSLPMLHNAMGMDAQGDMLMRMMAMNAGISSTKSGTWIRSFFEGMEPETGDGEHAKKHNENLRRFGMLDADNHVTWRKIGADGQTNWIESILGVAEKLGKGMASLPIDERMSTLKQMYGERGGGFGALMASNNFVEQLPVFANKLRNFQGADKALEDHAENSPRMKAMQTFRDFEIILADVGDKLLPAVNKGLHEFDDLLKSIQAAVNGNSTDLKKQLYDHLLGPDLNPVLKQFAPGPNDLTRPKLDPGADAMGLDAMRNGLLHKESFIMGGTGDGGTVDVLAQGVFKGLKFYAGDPGGINVGGPSGFTNAAYTTWDDHPAAKALSPLLRGQRGGGSYHGGGGANPYAGGTGGGSFVPPVGDHLTAGMRNNNLGNIGWFGQHMPGLLGPSNARDVDHSIGKFATQEDGIRAAAALALNKYHKGRHSTWDIIAAAGGWPPGSLGPGASVNVARAMGLNNRADVHLDDNERMVDFLHGLAVQEHGPAGQFYTKERIRAALGHRNMPVVTAPPPRRTTSPGSPKTMAENLSSIIINHQTVIDGKVIDKRTTKHLAQGGRFPTSGGGPDMHSHYSNPAGTPVTDAA